MHASITVHDETNLTPYLARAHDQQLREHLFRAEGSDRPTLLLVVGTSCTGKTRTLYEAVRQVLPDWQLTAPGTDSALCRLLFDGIPARTIVWLDELQDRLTTTPDGITAAKAIRELLHADHLGPILFAGTIWPTNLASLRARPTADQASTGAGAIPALLEASTPVEVPEVFTDTDLGPATLSQDPRLERAIATATYTEHPDRGRKITQVLAGGAQLIHRLYPPQGTHPPNTFSPAARAVLHAAGDLRRVGVPNPIPRWAIEGAAPGYLDTSTPPDRWLPAALDETTHAARHDDFLTNTRSHDIHHHGVPALTPAWITTPTGDKVEAYELHDYLLQDHLIRHRHTPTSQTLWDTLAARQHDPKTGRHIAEEAEQRGLLTPAIIINRHLADTGDGSAQQQLVRLLAHRGDEASLAELRARADTDDQPAQNRLADLLAVYQLDLLAERGDEASLAELRARADTDDLFARGRLAGLLVERGDEASLGELRARADTGDWFARGRLADLLIDQSDEPSLAELRARADTGDLPAGYRLADLLIDQSDEPSLAELRARADTGDLPAQERLADLLADRGDNASWAELRARAASGDLPAQERLADLLADRGDEASLAELRRLVLSGVGGPQLLKAHRSSTPDRHVLELDVQAQPRFDAN